MNNIIRIEDISAAELDVYARLTQAQLKNKQNPEKGLFIAEGIKVIEAALAAGVEPVSFLIEERHIEGKASVLCGPIRMYRCIRPTVQCWKSSPDTSLPAAFSVPCAVQNLWQ